MKEINMNKTINTLTLPTFLNERGVGFDRMFDMFEDTVGYTANGGYPPYNLIKAGDDDYAIEVAVAGFTLGDLEITQNGKKLTIAATKPEIEGEEPNYLHRGISARSFKRDFVLAEHVVVTGAGLDSGILTVKLHRELPEEMKPRTIAIESK
jgi:molecular chaperone IbpA